MYKFTTTDALAHDMGPGWERAGPNVVSKGRARILRESDSAYLCTVHIKDIIGARYGKTPFEAIVNCLEDVRRKRDAAEEILNLLTDNRHYQIVSIAEGAAAQARSEKVLENW